MRNAPQILSFLVIFGWSTATFQAQVDFNKTPDDDLGNVEDNFQQHFFEALKLKAIENYDRAIEELKICLQIKDNDAVVYFELGKNYSALKNYGAAETALKRAVSMDKDNEWYLDELYNVYYELEDYDKAIRTVKQLVDFHPDYKEDLANLYYRSQRYADALKVLDELDRDYGVTLSRDALRNKIYNETGNDKDRIAYLEQRIESNPKNEQNYLNLIYRYSELGDKTKAFSTAQLLLERLPESELVHLALYKFYLDNGSYDAAINSMKLVLKSAKVKPEAKQLVLTDFVNFVRDNPQFEAALVEVTTDVVSTTGGRNYAELGAYYLQNGDKEKALENFNLALERDSDNFEVLKQVLLLQLDFKQFEQASILSANAMELFPAQPIFYLLNGVALVNLDRPSEAISVMETGLDYLIDNVQMEADFYLQLSTAYRMINNISKADAFSKKADQIRLKQ